MMALIDRETVMDKIQDFFCNGCPVDNIAVCNCCDERGVIDAIKAIPTVDAKPVVHGEWTFEQESHTACCSVCGKRLQCDCTAMFNLLVNAEHYCFNCGSDMRGAKNGRMGRRKNERKDGTSGSGEGSDKLPGGTHPVAEEPAQVVATQADEEMAEA